MSDLENRISKIEEKLDLILQLLQNDCKKMSDHIDFIENVYDNIKSPFYFIMNKVNNFISNDNENQIICNKKEDNILLKED
jgi:hypothetical protein